MLEISEKDVLELKILHKSIKDKRKADRIKLILLLHKGFSQKEVAEFLLLDDDTVSKWRHLFVIRKDNTSWLEDNYVPYWGKLSSHELSHVRSYCQTFRVQSKQEIHDFIDTTMHVDYDLSSVQKLVRRIGLSHQQMHRLPGKIDPAKQAIFVEKYETIVTQLTDNQAIVFIDAVHPQHNTEPTKIWSVVGEQRYINSNTGRQRININGAYNPFNQDVIVRQDKTINGLSTIALFEQITLLYQKHKSQVLAFADNGRANKSRLVKQWLENQSFIKVIYLPPYSPNLNLIERLWKFMRKNVINTKYYSEFRDFKKAINQFFENIDSFKYQLKTFIGTKFQIFKQPLWKL
jgi:transposase